MPMPSQDKDVLSRPKTFQQLPDCNNRLSLVHVPKYQHADKAGGRNFSKMKTGHRQNFQYEEAPDEH